MEKKELHNKKFIISAAASGIGYVIANEIVQNGGKVFLTDIDQRKINLIKSKKNLVNKIFPTKIDCNNPEEVKNYFNSLKSLKQIDGLINNIGIAGPTQYLNNISINDWKKTIDTNLNTHFYFTKYAIPLLKKNKSASIINLSSTAGLYGFPQRSPYAASKWAILGLTKTLAMELGKFNIRVNALCPGSVEGDRMNRVVRDKASLIKSSQKSVKKDFESMVSLNAFVTKGDIASMVVFLLSKKSKNISGQIISVDGNTERMI